MQREISPSGCREIGQLSSEEIRLDGERSKFVLRKKLRHRAGKRKLGIVWLFLDPVVTSLVYLFVFLVIRSTPSAESLFVGISMFRIFNESITSGINSIQDFSGGLKSERVRTRVLIRSTIIFRVIDSSLQSLGVAIILLVGFNANPIGLVIYLISCQILGLVSEGFGLNLSLVVRKTPDISNIINYFLLLMFFGSPVLYPMTRMEGLHYKINEYNPLTYFIESSRYVLQLDSVLELLDPIIGVAIVVTVFLISVRGYFSVDKVRWEVSSWS